jgi:hypothetical protein
MAFSADLTRRDTRIPGLGLLLEPGRLLDSLHAQLARAPIEDIKPGYLRYKPGMNCLARYQICVGGRWLNAYAKAHGPDMSDKLKKAVERPSVDTAIGPGRLLLQDTGVIFSMFPNDAKLPTLLRLQDEASCHRLLKRIFQPQSGWQDGRVKKVLNYKPERRHVIQVRRADGEAALLKFYTRSGFARARAVSRGSAFIGESRKHGAIAYRWKPGSSLRELAARGELAAEHLAATGHELAAFHAGARKGLSRPDSGIEAKQINALGMQIGFLLPQLQDRAMRLAIGLIGWLDDRPLPDTPVHGDFYDKQVIVGKGDITLIDFDGARLDDPLADLGSYRAHLEHRVVSHEMSGSAADQQWQALVSAYESAAGTVPEDQLDRYVALGLFRLIHHPFRDCEEAWQEKTEQLLARAECLAGVSR